MSKRCQETTSSAGSPIAKPKPKVPARAKPVNLVLRSPWSARENLPQDLGYLVNPGNVDEGQGGHIGTRRLLRTTQNPEVERSQVRRQVNAQSSDSWKQCVIRRKLQEAIPRTKIQNMKYTNHQYMTKIFLSLSREVENYSRLLNILNGSIEKQMC